MSWIGGVRGIEYQRERAHLCAMLRTVDPNALSFLTVSEIKRRYRSRLGTGTIKKIKKVFIECREGAMGKPAGKLDQIGHQMVLERIANVISKSYVHLGDAEKVASEDALTMIKRELQHFDPSIIKRNERRALPKTAPSLPDNKLAVR